MILPKLNFEQTVQRVSQMRRLALSLREAYEKQFKLEAWLSRFNKLRTMPPDQFPAKLSKADLDALRAGFRENWAKGNFAIIAEVAEKLSAEVLQRDHVLAAFAGVAHERINVSS